MKISKIRIENFRSIESAVFEPTDFNIYVGQNNCGKTNFFEAIEFFFNGIGRGVNINDLKFKREEDRELLVELTFSQALDGAAQMKHEGNRAKIEKILDGCDEVVVL
jgi:Recombinational DNA repair ATPase (RecF pathway)